MKFNEGDKVKYISGAVKSHMTHGKIYEIVATSPSKGLVTVVRDDGRTEDFYDHRFEEVEITDMVELIERAKTFIGKKCVSSDVTFTPNQVIVVVDEYSSDNYSKEVQRVYKANGFAVALRDNVRALTFPVNETRIFIHKAKTLKLTDDYDADIYPNRVVVGCQTISIEKIEELYKLIHSFE
jgi:hypothetical protein